LHIVLDGAPQLPGVGALLLGNQLVHQQQHAGRRVDGHGGRDFVQGDARKQRLHVTQRVDGHPDLSYLALGQGMVGIVAHLRR